MTSGLVSPLATGQRHHGSEGGAAPDGTPRAEVCENSQPYSKGA